MQFLQVFTVLLVLLPVLWACSFSEWSGLLPNPHGPPPSPGSPGVLKAQRTLAGFNAPKPDSIQAAKIALHMEQITRESVEDGRRRTKRQSGPRSRASRPLPTFQVRVDPRLNRDKVLVPVCREEREESKCHPDDLYRFFFIYIN